jgi:hypothetical protein
MASRDGHFCTQSQVVLFLKAGGLAGVMRQDAQWNDDRGIAVRVIHFEMELALSTIIRN